jgi:hypothetical protein
MPSSCFFFSIAVKGKAFSEREGETQTIRTIQTSKRRKIPSFRKKRQERMFILFLSVSHLNSLDGPEQLDQRHSKKRRRQKKKGFLTNCG